MAGKVVVMLTDSEEGHVYEGDYDAQLTPNGQLLIVENIADVTGKSKDGLTTRIRCIYNCGRWEQVGVT